MPTRFSHADLRGAPPSVEETLRRAASAGLRKASAALVRLSRRIGRPVPARPTDQPRLEFHADAGAPEGALYVDGKLVGWVIGVRRL